MKPNLIRARSNDKPGCSELCGVMFANRGVNEA